MADPPIPMLEFCAEAFDSLTRVDYIRHYRFKLIMANLRQYVKAMCSPCGVQVEIMWRRYGRVASTMFANRRMSDHVPERAGQNAGADGSERQSWRT
jgi:hypothetical protein